MCYVASEGMTPVLNDTKWKTLFNLLRNSDYFFQYKRTDVDGSTFPEDGVSHTPEIEQYWGNFWAIEWFEILAQRIHPRGELLRPEIEDFTDEAVRIAHESGVKFTKIEGGIKVWGYIRKSEHSQFVPRG